MDYRWILLCSWGAFSRANPRKIENFCSSKIPQVCSRGFMACCRLCVYSQDLVLLMTKKILAIASGGGHWQQLMAMRPALAGHDTFYLTTLPGLPEQFGAAPARIIPDCNRDQKLAIVRTSAVLLRELLRHRPDVVISTGALPGVIALALGRAIGARTIWVDSVANAEEMSMSGRLARRVAHLWMSQWEHVAKETGAEYAGAVL